jgi:uncharacterized Zn finger protein
MRDHLPEPVHFLDGLRCPNCSALNASWLRFLAECDASAVVECAECGAVSRVQVADVPGISEAGEAA